MDAKVNTYGGEVVSEHGVSWRTVQHWQLYVDGTYIADTSQPELAQKFQKIADACNSHQAGA